MVSPFIIWISAVALIVLFYLKCVWPHSYWERQGVLQAPSVWGFGEIWRTLLGYESFVESIIRLYNKFPNARYFGTYEFNTPIFIPRDIALIKQIGIKHFDYFVDRRIILPGNVDSLWASNIFSLNGQKWKDMRVLLTPTFTSSKMKNIFILMKDAADNFVSHFGTKPGEIIEINFKDTLNRYACDVIASTAFGIETNSLTSPKNDFYEAGVEFTDFTGWRSLIFWGMFVLPPWIMKLFRFKIYSDKVTKLFTGIIDDTIKTREEKQITRMDMIHLLTEARKGRHGQEDENIVDTGYATAKTYFSHKIPSKLDISNDDIAAQASVFFFGGFAEISTAMGFLIYELTVAPNIQNKLRNEINETFEQCKGNLTYEALMEMNYMDMVVTETLRKWPTNGNLERVCTRTFPIRSVRPEENDIIIEKGTLVWIPIFGVQYDPQYFPDPQKFDPERFSRSNRDKLNSNAFLSFGIGPRNCIGSRFAIMEIKVLFFHLLRKFEIIPIEKSKIPIEISRKSFTLDGNCFWFGLKKLNVN